MNTPGRWRGLDLCPICGDDGGSCGEHTDGRVQCMGTNQRRLTGWVEVGPGFNGRTMFRRQTQLQGGAVTGDRSAAEPAEHRLGGRDADATGVAAADRHQKDIDHAVAMLISAGRSARAWYRSLRGLCKLDTTMAAAEKAAGVCVARDEQGREGLWLEMAAAEPVCSCIAEAGKDGGM